MNSFDSSNSSIYNNELANISKIAEDIIFGGNL